MESASPTSSSPSCIRHVADVSTSRFALAASEVLLLNPNTGTLPVFRSRADADITLGCYRRTRSSSGTAAPTPGA